MSITDQMPIKSYISNLIDTDLTIRLSFAEFLPIYAESQYHKDLHAQQLCIESITGRLMLKFPQNMRIDPFSRNHIKQLLIEVMNDQLNKTPQFIREELKQLKAKINTLFNMVGSFIEKIDLEVANKKRRFDERSQDNLFGFKKECILVINEFISILNNLNDNIVIDGSFDIDTLTSAIFKRGKKNRKTAKFLKDNFEQHAVPLSSTPSSEEINLDQRPAEIPILPSASVSNTSHNSNACNFNEFSLNDRSQFDILNEPNNGSHNDLEDGKSNEETHEFEQVTTSANQQTSYPFCAGFPNVENEIEFAFDVTTIMDAGTFTFHLLSQGLTPTQAINFLNRLGIKCYSISTICRSQNAIDRKSVV